MSFEYRDVFVETYKNPGKPSNAELRVRPLPDQGFSTNMKAKCSGVMREQYSVETVFRITAKLIEREGGWQFPYFFIMGLLMFPQRMAKKLKNYEKGDRKRVCFYRISRYKSSTSLSSG